MHLGICVAASCLAGGCLLTSEQPDATDPEDDPYGSLPLPPYSPAPKLADCGGAGDCVQASIAVGGTSQLSITSPVVVTGPFEWLGDGVIRATAAGQGTIGGENFLIPVWSRPIGGVRLGPLFTRGPRLGFVLDSETIFPEDLPGIMRPFALHVSDPHAVVRLWSTEYDQPYGAQRLVDTTLKIREAPQGVRLTSWDVIEVPAVAGVHRVVVEADSFGSYELEIPVVDHLDRIEPEVWQTPGFVGDTAHVCFHAYTGFVEVAIDMTIAVDGAGQGAGGPGRNCVGALTTGPGTMTVTATAGELTSSIDFVTP